MLHSWGLIHLWFLGLCPIFLTLSEVRADCDCTSGSRHELWCEGNGLALPVAFLHQIWVGKEVASLAPLSHPLQWDEGFKCLNCSVLLGLYTLLLHSWVWSSHASFTTNPSISLHLCLIPHSFPSCMCCKWHAIPLGSVKF